MCAMMAENTLSLRRYGLAGWQWLASGVVVLIVGSIMAFTILQPVQVRPRIRLAPGFALTDQDGRPLTSEDLRGRIVLYSFTYTRCQPPCPQTGQIMREIQERLGKLDVGDVPVTLVTISIDPEYDTPERLRAYAASLGADPTRWRFATSDPSRLKYVVGGGFEVYYTANTDGSFTLAPVFVLVDGWGIIRSEYRYQTLTPDVERMVRHIRVVAEEVRNSRGTARFAYEAAHLFLCYAP